MSGRAKSSNITNTERTKQQTWDKKPQRFPSRVFLLSLR